MTDYSLPRKDLEILRRAHKRERNKKYAYRINAVYLLGKGWTLQEVSEALLLNESTLRHYARRYREGKIRLLLSDDYQAYDGKLTKKEEHQLDLHLEEITYRRAGDIIAYIEEEFDVTYTVRGVRKLLHRLGYSYKKPQRVPGQSNPQEQLAFIKRYRRIRQRMKALDSLFFMDGVHPQHNPLVMNGWIKKGKKKKLRTNTQFHRLNINGAVDIDSHEVITQLSQRLTEESTLDFLEKLRKKRPQGKLYLVLDNAGYYTTAKVREYAKACSIELLYLPPYSPNLNLIERVWLFFQKSVLYNIYYPTFESFKKACVDFFKKRNLRRYRDELCSVLTEKFELVTH